MLKRSLTSAGATAKDDLEGGRCEAPGPEPGRQAAQTRPAASSNAAQYLSVEVITEAEFADSNRVVSYRPGSQGKLTARFMMKECGAGKRGVSVTRGAV
ncbi:hypothetical protein [Prosthecobacter debontii]|uniref:hypothetical protein n=1 Tax=Prosthecobacter debontii TaxID=48467 RepID=UPI00111644F2|nr:hypothetical protein [Prosthecobacter debontii]